MRLQQCFLLRKRFAKGRPLNVLATRLFKFHISGVTVAYAIQTEPKLPSNSASKNRRQISCDGGATLGQFQDVTFLDNSRMLLSRKIRKMTRKPCDLKWVIAKEVLTIFSATQTAAAAVRPHPQYAICRGIQLCLSIDALLAAGSLSRGCGFCCVFKRSDFVASELFLRYL